VAFSPSETVVESRIPDRCRPADLVSFHRHVSPGATHRDRRAAEPRAARRGRGPAPIERLAVVPLESFHDLFAASAGVAGALIGLLFVAISVAPERLTGDDAPQAHRVRASTALTSFTNALSVSLFALVPGLGVGWTALVVAAVGILFVATSLLSLVRVRRSQPGELRDAAFLIGTAVTFLVQLAAGVRAIMHPSDIGPVRTIAIIVIVCFLIGIARSWELIGGPTFRMRREIGALARAGDADAEAEAGAE
jgi:hypothetical protein